MVLDNAMLLYCVCVCLLVCFVQVECVQWYPADAGLFSTSSRDKKVKIWDPNRMKLVDQFDLDCHIHHHHMSPVATKHSLLAVAGDSGKSGVASPPQKY